MLFEKVKQMYLQTDVGAAILDEMKLELTNMKISKVVVCKVGEVSSPAHTGENFSYPT